jgi:hypothetical protein
VAALRKANLSFRLRLHSGLRQSGDRFAVGFDAGLKPRSISEAKTDPSPFGKLRVRMTMSKRGASGYGITRTGNGNSWIAAEREWHLEVGSASSGSFDFATDDETVSRFAQDDNVLRMMTMPTKNASVSRDDCKNRQRQERNTGVSPLRNRR